MTSDMRSHFRALHLSGEEVVGGYLPPDVATLLLRNGLLVEAAGRLFLARGDLSTRLEDIRIVLAGARMIGPFRDEVMPVRTTFDGPVLGAVDRSVLRVLGLWATKVHINGVVRDAQGLSIWLSRRAPTSTAEPGAYDTMVAGGQSLRETVLGTAHKEAWEEAGLGENEMQSLRSVGRAPVEYVSSLGFHRELLVVYDLDVDPQFEPVCADGEIDQHIRVELDALNGGEHGIKIKHSSHIVCTDLLARFMADETSRGGRFVDLGG